MVSSSLTESPVSGPEQLGSVPSYVLWERCATAEDHQTAFLGIDGGAVAQLGEHLLCNYSSLSAVLPNRAAGPKSAQLCAVKSGRLFGIRSPLTAFYHATRGLKFCGRRASPRASPTGAVRTGIPKESCRGGAPATKGVGRPLRSSS